jgi:hypothetical protein
MDYYTGSKLWRTNNGHSNTTLGGSGSNKIDLFDARRGRTRYYMAMQDQVYLAVDNSAPAWGPTLQPFKGTLIRNSGWYGGVAGSLVLGSGDYDNWYNANGVVNGIGSHTGVAGGMAHEFSCSKCHSPHATGLPALLKTNCVDVQLRAWTNSSNSAVGYNADQANNCHRKTATTDGWHKLAPKQ